MCSSRKQSEKHGSSRAEASFASHEDAGHEQATKVGFALLVERISGRQDRKTMEGAGAKGVTESDATTVPPPMNAGANVPTGGTTKMFTIFIIGLPLSSALLLYEKSCLIDV
jgi:hypothetical protein